MDPRTPSGEAVWNSPAWLEEATAWIDAGLRAAGRARVGAPERWRVRRWSALLTVETDAGRVWMKAPRPECGIEVDLYETPGPGLVEPLAVDTERGWLLLPDAGTPLSAERDGEVVVGAVEAALRDYGSLQRALSSRVDALLAADADDLRPGRLHAVLEEVCTTALADLHEAGDPGGVAHHVHAARARGGEVEAWGAELAAAGVGASIDHGDLHLDNVLAGPRGLLLIDWGDAVVGHPFASLRVMLDAVADKLAVGRGDPRLERVRDGYLESFAHLAALDELREVAALATRIAPIHRAVAIQRAVRSLPGEPPPDPHWAGFVARELAELGN